MCDCNSRKKMKQKYLKNTMAKNFPKFMRDTIHRSRKLREQQAG
jgi:hypothetical protein